jgi:hypothetical protein
MLPLSEQYKLPDRGLQTREVQRILVSCLNAIINFMQSPFCRKTDFGDRVSSTVKKNNDHILS